MPKHKETNYVDRALLRLRRQYTENETIQALGKRNSELQIKIGMMRSELDEADFKYKIIEKKLMEAKALSLNTDIQPNVFSNLKAENKNLKKRIKAQCNSISEYGTKLMQLKKENERLKSILNQHNIPI